MAKGTGAEAREVLNRFVDIVFRLMVDNHQEQVARLDLTLLQAQALRLLRRKPLCTGDLATELRVSAPAVTQLIDRLMRKELIERRAADGDRRSVMISLNEKGRRVVDRVRSRRNEVFCGALGQLNAADREQVILALSKLVMALEKYEERAA
ncbi:MAG TPA: MarR family transcriptional regulator [Blastocatellia bacterium]|nr:MarR family transcriptional regulator [Blastocatellia bacterium]